jgi:hypothetical protein
VFHSTDCNKKESGPLPGPLPFGPVQLPVVFGKEIFLRKLADMLGQTRFVPCGRVLVNNALADGLIDQRHRWVQKLSARSLVISGNRRSQLLYRRAKLAAAAAVDLIAFYVLSNALFCRFMISH